MVLVNIAFDVVVVVVVVLDDFVQSTIDMKIDEFLVRNDKLNRSSTNWHI